MATSIRTPSAVASAVVQAVRDFLAVEAAGGILLLLATAAALGWANSPWQAAYHDLWHTKGALTIGTYELAEDLRHWVNDGLMALFFFVVGLEIKRELVSGELQDRRKVALPVFAAAGGMVVPAAVYLLLNAGGAGTPGWGIPMATDIAFALGVVSLLGDRVPASLKLFLLTLAVVDDVGAILVIAVAYTDDLAPLWLGAAAGGLAVMGLLRRGRVDTVVPYVLIGVFVWFATLESGVHATIAGAVLGLLAPAAVAERLQHALHPWTSFVVIPIFALANTGVTFTVDGLGAAAGSTVTLGVVAGLVLGKLAGVTAAGWVAVRLGWADLPDGVAWRQVAAIATVSGIGFTVSLFVSALAFDDPTLRDEATIGVLVASVLAAVLGSVLLRRAHPVRHPTGAPSGS